MEKQSHITDLNKRVCIIERSFSHNGEDYSEVLAYDKINDMIEYIGTSYDTMEYYYNKDFIVFVKDDEVEFAFDTNKFCFINDESKKMIAFKKILKSAQSEYTETERNIIRESDEKTLAKVLTKRSK